MNNEHIKQLMDSTEEDIKFVSSMSNDIVVKQTKDLDELMLEIQDNVINAVNEDDEIIEHYLAELTNAVYFVSSRCETFGFYDDVTKANARVKYNELYAENQTKSVSEKKKPTVAENQLYAESGSIDETMLNIIYSRSLKIVKSKVESASEMIRTLSKILSVHMNERNLPVGN